MLQVFVGDVFESPCCDHVTVKITVAYRLGSTHEGYGQCPGCGQLWRFRRIDAHSHSVKRLDEIPRGR